MTSKEIRQTFLDFFKSKNHIVVPSAPMVVKNDPTLMFTNAGMNQFKNLFLGNAPVKHSRVVNTQKCLRVSGKHNDLEEVGVDTYHHTMFEMLGNWSFGNPAQPNPDPSDAGGYFKKEAIAWAWELLTEVYKIDAARLYVTVFEGSEADNLAFDQESYNHWKKFIPEDRILKGSKKDNFWEMGDTGPCGPCTEIHADIRSEEDRKKKDGKILVNTAHPQVIEIWNNVFMEFNRKANGSLEKLPAQHVDTGMGFERLCMLLQGKQSNYDTDVFTPLIQKIAELSKVQYGSSVRSDIAIRVIADHVRAIAFSIADGQLPSNTGAGYVIRRILRRAVRYGYQSLGFKEAFIFKLSGVLVEQMGDAFPELKKQHVLIEKVVREEETSFYKTLERGLTKINAIKEKVLSGEIAFELYDTYGFPIDLTQLIGRENGFEVDMDGFNKCMEQQKNRSREATSVDTGDCTAVDSGHGVRDSKFVGYEKTNEQTTVLQYRKVKTKNKEQYQIVLSKTPFYAESGGQVGDTGYLDCGTEKISITDTKKENGISIHYADKLPKE
ncbi:MAG: alanine--tRNA ligase, partial [Bacteroidia bacterium]|nr:alanine--tRNA ligase [Bacteroidia bacterium]